MKRLKREEMVVMATCQQTKLPYGITARKIERDYEFYWAFKITPSSAKREGFDKTKVTGNIYMSNDYPGCPHCGATSWFQCGRCGRFVCMHPEQQRVKCPECGNEGTVEISDKFDLSGGAM